MLCGGSRRTQLEKRFVKISIVKRFMKQINSTLRLHPSGKSPRRLTPSTLSGCSRLVDLGMKNDKFRSNGKEKKIYTRNFAAWVMKAFLVSLFLCHGCAALRVGMFSLVSDFLIFLVSTMMYSVRNNPRSLLNFSLKWKANAWERNMARREQALNNLCC